MKAFGLLSLIITTLIVAVLVMKQLGPGSATSPENIKRSEAAARRAVAQMNQALAQSAVGAYRAQKDRFPGSLDALVKDGYLERVPEGLNYDPATGVITLAEPEAAPAAEAPASPSGGSGQPIPRMPKLPALPAQPATDAQ